MRKKSFYVYAIKKVKKETYVEIQNDFRNMFNFYDSLYGSWVKGKGKGYRVKVKGKGKG